MGPGCVALAFVRVLAAAALPCPPAGDTQRSLQQQLPELRRDLRRWLPWLRAEGRLPPGGGAIPWQACGWAGALCQLPLPWGTELRLVHPDSGGATLRPSRLVWALCLARGEVWLEERSGGRRRWPLAGRGADGGPRAVPEGGAEVRTQNEQVVLVLPLDEADCRAPLGLEAPFLQAASWASEWVLEEFVGSRGRNYHLAQILRPLNYIVTNLFLGIKHSGRTDKLGRLQLWSWRFVSLASLEAWEMAKEQVYATVREFLAHLLEIRGDLSQGEAFLPTQLRIAAPRPPPPTTRSPRETLSVAGVRVPALGLHTAGLSDAECFRAAAWAVELGAPHLLVEGPGACEEAVGAALRVQVASGAQWPFISLVLAEESAEDAQRGLARQLRRLGLERAGLLVVASRGAGAAAAPAAAAALRPAAVRPTAGWAAQRADAVPDIQPWCLHGPLGALAQGGGLVQVSSGACWDFPLDFLADPHLLGIAAELGRPALAVVARYHLQDGRGVILPAPSTREELQSVLELDFELPFAHVARLRGLPTLARSLAGDLRPVDGDVYGLSAVPSAGRLAAQVEDSVQDVLQAVLPEWSAMPCIRSSARECAGGEDALATAACLLGRAQASLGANASPAAEASPPGVAITALPLWSPAAEALALERLAELRARGGLGGPAPRFAVLDDFLPEHLAESLEGELQQRDLCTLLALCTTGLQCAIDPLGRSKFREFLRFRSDIPAAPTARALHRFMQSEPLLAALTALRAPEPGEQPPALQPDGHYPLGTYIEVLPGGFLGLHEDLSSGADDAIERRVLHKDLRLPRLNAVLFLGDLGNASGGRLELWRLDPHSGLPGRPAAQISARRNRLVLFDAVDGIHGQPWPLRGSHTRRLLQWYYAGAGGTVAGITFYDMPCGADCYDGVSFQ